MALELLWNLLIYIVILVVSTIPLLMAVKFLGGRASILKIILVNLGAAVIIVLLRSFLTGLVWGFLVPIIVFIALLVIYNIIFELGWVKAFFAWILQFVFAWLLIRLVAWLWPNLVTTATWLLSPRTPF